MSMLNDVLYDEDPDGQGGGGSTDGGNPEDSLREGGTESEGEGETGD
jgi:hypothetical protein